MSTPNSNTPLFPTCAVAIDVADQDLPVGTLFVGGGGNVSVIPANGSVAVLFKNITPGGTVPVLVKALRASGTNATDLIILW